MKAQELRIRNYVRRKSTGEEFPVDVMNIAFIESDSKGKYEQSFEPIPLTPEWLYKFYWDGYNDLCFNSWFKLDKEGRLYYHNDYTGINVNYVHQLQNLYFALTGKELELK